MPAIEEEGIKVKYSSVKRRRKERSFTGTMSLVTYLLILIHLYSIFNWDLELDSCERKAV
jgi:hypothetical protein